MTSKKNQKRIACEALNHWLTEIDKLVSTDFCADMECRFLPKAKPFTQGEAREMAEIIGNVYMYAHRIHCGACAKK